MLETDRTTTLDPQARLAVLLATTGLTQLDLARLLPVAGRTVRRWMQGVLTPVKAELFPTEVRALGVGLTYAVANAMFGGTAEYVALWLKSAGRESWFAWYVAGMVAIGLAASLLMPDTRKYGYLEGSGQIER